MFWQDGELHGAYMSERGHIRVPEAAVAALHDDVAERSGSRSRSSPTRRGCSAASSRLPEPTGCCRPDSIRPKGGSLRSRTRRRPASLDRHLVVSFPEKVPAKLIDAVQIA